MAVQRNLKVAQALARDAEKKKAEAVRLAIEFDNAKTAAREAGQVRFPLHLFMHMYCSFLAFCIPPEVLCWSFLWTLTLTGLPPGTSARYLSPASELLPSFLLHGNHA